MEKTYPSTYSEQKAYLDEEIAKNKTAKELQDAFSLADTFINKNYLDVFQSAELVQNQNGIKDISKLRIIEMTKIVFDSNEDINDKLSSVYNALYNLDVSVAVILVGQKSETKFYYVIRSETMVPLAGDVMESMLKGNFPGVELRRLNNDESKEFIQSLSLNEYGEKKIKGLATVNMVPSEKNKDKNEKGFVQGLEKFIDTMLHKEYVAVLLAKPLHRSAVINRLHGLEELYSALSPHAKLSIAYGENVSTAVNKGISKSFSDSVNESVTNTNSTSTSDTSTTTTGKSSGWSSGGGSSSEGSSSSWGYNSGTNSSTSSSYTSGSSFSSSIGKSVGKTETNTFNEGVTKTLGSSLTHTVSFDNKGVNVLMQQIDEQIKRIKTCESYGLWDTCAYFFSQDISTSVLAATTYKALMTGDSSAVEKAHVNIWENKIKQQKMNVQQILESVTHLIHPLAHIKMNGESSGQKVTPTSLIGGNEIPLLLSLPRKSVKGVSVIEMAEFGRNVIYENYYPNRSFSIGKIYHMGVKEETKVDMNLDLFNSHCFITGSSGSGKSYATYNLLDSLIKHGIGMLVIEPAKGEYKQVFGRVEQIQIFTTSIDTYKFIRLNPFQFPDEIHILSHIERLLQIFNASWPLYAAMPAILKEAVVEAYVSCGWDIRNSIWIENEMQKKYPVFSDILTILPKIINSSDYSSDAKGDYKGALLTRVQSMSTGIIGEIFENSVGIEDEILFEGNTIIDLSEVGSEETIALMMGIVIMKLNEYRISQRKKGIIDSHDTAFRHVTVLEEAHNLLKRTSKDQNQEGANMVGKSVEMISNSIKEMRTYGEGFIIIDQSPLAVDESAIENTATKIIMNTPSKSACDELGSSLSLNENQTRELSRLNVGVAAVMQKGWMQPVLMKVEGTWKMSDYEAPMQVAIPSIIHFIRGKMVEEFLLQVHNQNYSARKLSNIVRNADALLGIEKKTIKQGEKPTRKELVDWSTYRWFLDRRSEFEQSIELLKGCIAKKEQFTSRLVGKILMKICRCEKMFDLISYEGIITVNEAKDMEVDDEFYINQIYIIRGIYRNILKQLNKYAQIHNEELQGEMVWYMLESIDDDKRMNDSRIVILRDVLQMLIEEGELG